MIETQFDDGVGHKKILFDRVAAGLAAAVVSRVQAFESSVDQFQKFLDFAVATPGG